MEQTEIAQRELTVQNRAALALNTSTREQALQELKAQSTDIVLVNSKDGRTQVHTAAMALRTARTTISKLSKDARDDATQFCKAMIEEEKRLIAIVEPEETRLLKLRDDWDAALEAEKQAKIKAEQVRVAAIKTDIQTIRNTAIKLARKPSSVIYAAHEALDAIEFTEERFAEFKGDAAKAVGEAMDDIITLYTKTTAAEKAEAERIAEQQRIQAEQAAIAIQQAKEKAELEKQRLELKAQQEQMAAAMAAIEAAKAAQEPASRPVDVVAPVVVTTSAIIAQYASSIYFDITTDIDTVLSPLKQAEEQPSNVVDLKPAAVELMTVHTQDEILRVAAEAVAHYLNIPHSEAMTVLVDCLEAVAA